MPGKTKPQPKPMGRPVVISEDTQQRIIAHIADGGTITSYCEKHKHISRQTVFNFMLKEAGENFKENVSRAREHGMHAMAEDCLKIIDNPKEDTMRARNRVELRMKLAAAWRRQSNTHSNHHRCLTSRRQRSCQHLPQSFNQLMLIHRAVKRARTWRRSKSVYVR